jgi:hypothetical protein
MNTQPTIEERLAALEAGILNKQDKPRAEDQHLLDAGWIRHFGDECPVHPKTRVLWITSLHNLTPDTLLDNSACVLLWNTSHNVVSSHITHYKITKEYVEPPTFDIVVNGVTYTINKPYMSAPALATVYWGISLFGDIATAVYSAPSIDYNALKNHNCWKTKEDAEAYLKVKKIRDDFEMGETT